MARNDIFRFTDKLNELNIENHVLLLRLLKKMDGTAELHQPHVLHNAIRRYETCWLPYMGEHGRGDGGRDKSPPLDVAWIWHVHKLAPVEYHKDCKNILGFELDDIAPAENVTCPDVSSNTELWKKMFPEEPFHIEDYKTVDLDIKYEQKSGYNLIAAAERQREFYYHVSMPHYLNSSFRLEAINRYRKFMELKKKHPGQFLVPMYDIDLVWHTHQLMATEYKEDTENFFGHILHHDDSTTDRTPGSKRNNDEAETKRLWLKEYGTKLAIPGTMYRGKSTRGRMNDFDMNHFIDTLPTRYKLRIEGVEFISSTKTSGKLSVGISVLINGSQISNISALGYVKSNSGHFAWDHQTKKDCKFLPLDVVADLHDTVVVKAVILQAKGIPLINRENIPLHNFTVDLREAVKEKFEIYKEEKWSDGNHFAVESELDADRNIKLNCFLVRFTTSDAKLKVVQTNQFRNESMTKDLGDIWGPVPVHHISPKEAEAHPDVRIADQEIQVCETNGTVMTTRVIHSLPLKMSAIQIFQNNEMVAVSHLIGLDQLPQSQNDRIHAYSWKESSELGTLNLKRGDRAMLIKGNEGDWGLVVAHWDGFKAPLKGMSSYTNKPFILSPGNAGWLNVEFTDLRSTKDAKTKDATFYDMTRPKAGRNYSIKLANMSMTLNYGTSISLSQASGEYTDIPENVALALSIITLFVLCEPRDKISINSVLEAQGYKSPNYSSKPASQHSRHMYGSSEPRGYEIFCYCGYYEETPSNSHLRKCKIACKNNEKTELEPHGKDHSSRDKFDENDPQDDDGTDECTDADLGPESLYDPFTSDYFSDSSYRNEDFCETGIWSTLNEITGSSDSGGGHVGGSSGSSGDTGFGGSSDGGGSSCGSSCGGCAASCGSSSGGGGGSDSGGGGGSSCGSGCGSSD